MIERTCVQQRTHDKTTQLFELSVTRWTRFYRINTATCNTKHAHRCKKLSTHVGSIINLIFVRVGDNIVPKYM